MRDNYAPIPGLQCFKCALVPRLRGKELMGTDRAEW
jgi:hypothetical protein